jgi:hypothetical protein
VTHFVLPLKREGLGREEGAGRRRRRREVWILVEFD